MQRKVWSKIPIILMIVTCFFTGCQNKNEKSMNKLTINFQEGDLPSLHPHDLIVHLRGIAIGKLLYEGLTHLDESSKIHLAGAESLDVSQDRLRYTFTLRDNHWSDGTPVTAYQYEAAWKEALNPNSSCSRANLLYLIKNAEEAKKGELSLDKVGVKAMSDKVLVVDLAYPTSFFLDLAAQPICAPLVDPKNRKIRAFNGPFSVLSWERDDCLKLQGNPYFWNKKKVALKEIDIFMMPDSSTAFNVYEAGKLDWIGSPFSPLTAEQAKDLQSKHVSVSRQIDRSFWIHLNNKHPALASLAIRRALSLSLDRATIAKEFLIGGTPLHRVLPDDLLPVKMKASCFLREDKHEAEMKFNEGLVELGLTREQFPTLTISYAQQSNRKKLAEYLQETWKKVLGIEVRLEQQEWNVLRYNAEKRLFDIFGAFEASYYYDPLEILENLGEERPSNFSQWVNPAYRDLIAAARRELDCEKHSQLLGKAEEILLKETPFIPVCTDQFLFAHRKGLKGFAFDSVGAVDFRYAYFQ
jgi:oligopeptide transport system substrate-binding protein